MMTITRKRLTALAIAVALMIALIPSGLMPAAKADNNLGMTTVDTVNLREGASPKAKFIVQLPKGYVCTVLSETDAEGYHWYRVEAKNPEAGNDRIHTGYVRGDCFRRLTDEEAATASSGSTSSADSSTVVNANTSVSGETGRVVNGSGVNVRAAASTRARSLMKLNRGDIVTVLEVPSVTNSSETFYKIQVGNTTGYIMSTFLELTGGTVTTPPSGGGSTATGSYATLKLSSCHLRETPAGNYDSANDWLGTGTSLPLAGDGISKNGIVWYPVTKNGRTWYVADYCVTISGGGQPTSAPTSDPGVVTYVTTIVGGVNLRSTMGGSVIRQLGKGETYPVLTSPGQKGGYTWYFVQAGSDKGYLRNDVVKVSGDTPTSAPTGQPSGNLGYVKTTAGGVNYRKAAGYTDPLGRVDKGVVLPYYETSVVKNVTWYKTVHPTLGTGWIHGDFVILCDENGNPTEQPTGAPTSQPSGAQEASYNTLKVGSTGNAVLNLTTELKRQGYFSGTPTKNYTAAVATAVRNFQKAKGLTVDGIAGAATQHKLYGTVPIGAGDNSNLTMTIYPAEKIDWYTGGINELWKRGDNYKVYDVKTGIVWWAHRWSGGYHVDAEPLTAADTARLCKSYGVTTAQEIADKDLWQRRPLLVTIGTRTFCCSLYGEPHNYPDGDTISNNDFKGQLCIHFTNSRTHVGNAVDKLHAEAIQYAYDHAPNGHK